MPNEIMLQWLDSGGSWEHRAYWGADVIAVRDRADESADRDYWRDPSVARGYSQPD
jgi:hypothetical protein